MKKTLKSLVLATLVVVFCICSAFSLMACNPTPNSTGGSDGYSSSYEPNQSESSIENSSTPDSSISDSSNPDNPPDSSIPDEPNPEPEIQYDVVSGALEEGEEAITVTSSNTLAVKIGGEFSQGTISAVIDLAGSGGDNGIVFGLKNLEFHEKYWEHTGVFYYFFFISNAGTAYLGKVSDTAWIVCGETVIPNLDKNGRYLLEVSRDKSAGDYDVIRCYVNGELYVSYKDNRHIDGTAYGIRAGAVGTSYENIKISDEIKGASATLNDYVIANGSYEQQGEYIVATTGNAIAEKKEGEFIYGSLEVKMNINGANADNGIIFGLTPNELHAYWEQDVSYYFFFISFQGLAYLGKVDNGSWTVCQHVELPGYSASKNYTLRIEKDATTIYGYVDGVCYVTYADSFPLTGTGYGFRAGAKGVAYHSVKCESSGEIVETYPEDLEVLSGKFIGANGAARSATTENFGIVKNTTLTEGSYSVNIKGVSTKRAGIIFGYSKEVDSESYYRFVTRKEAQKVEVDKVVDGKVTNVYSNYLSAGYSTGAEMLFKVVIKEGKAYCYYGNNLYVTFEMELTGDKVGIYAEGPATQFRAYATSERTELTTVDTLLFGHSYFELWRNYVNDLSALAKEYNFGSYLNIGIGGSVASHWEKFKESLAVYGADRVIYMIGINDLTGGTSPASVVASVEETLTYLKEINPELTVVLLSVNHCPARNNIRAQVSQTNVLMQELCAKYDWIAYAEVEYAFCDNGSTPDAYWFTDGLHPTANGYVQKIVPAIKEALDGKNQPVVDEEMQKEMLAKAKELKKIVLTDYAEWSYRASEWALAKPHYEEAIMLIDACESVEAVEALDLSEIIAKLKVIKRNTDYVYEDMVSANGCSVWETATFTNALNSSENGKYNLTHDGHRLIDNRQYTDMSFTFCLSDITADFDTVGILFRAKQIATLGIQGYMINIVTEPNYIQIWHFNGAYGNSGGSFEYIGGWVFPNEVENTLFRVVVENGYCYVYTEEDFQSKGKESYGCSVDLSYGGALKTWESGGLGVLCWNSKNSASGKLLIDNVSGKLVESAPEVPTSDKTEEVVSALTNGTDLYTCNTNQFTGGENGSFGASGYAFRLYNGLDLDNFKMKVKATDAVGDVGVAGFLFRCKKNATNNGVDGYLFNYVSNANAQYIQIFYLTNCYNSDSSALVCDYIGGWVFPGKVIGTEFDVEVEGDFVTIIAGEQSIAVALNGTSVGKTYTTHASGGVGIICWQDNAINLNLLKIEA